MVPTQNEKAQLFGEPRFVQNSFAVIFPLQLDIRRRVNDFETKLSTKYGQPQILNIPDELEPEAPRAIFISSHGHSQIIVNQVSVTVNINYSPEWQTNDKLRSEYLIDRATLLFDLVNMIKVKGKPLKPYYCGLTTLVHIPNTRNELDTLKFLSGLFHMSVDISAIHDLQQKITKVSSNKYFSNMNIENYRNWKIEVDKLPTVNIRLSRYTANEQGIQIIGDYNDRFAFQERKTYSTSKSEVFKVIDQGLSVIAQTIEQIKGSL